MTIDDKDIIKAIRQDAEKGFRLLLAKYSQPIYWHLRRLLPSHDDAQDAAQETLVKVFRSLSQLKSDATLKAWLYRIATREALRIIAQNQRDASATTGEGNMLEAKATADSYVDYSDLEAVKLQRAIKSLPTKQQLAFNMRYYDELEYGEIAEIVGSTPTTVKVNYHLAKEKIIKFMNEND